jgi:hypothetical protein
MAIKNELAELIYNYWTQASPPDDPIIKPAFRDVLALGALGNQFGEYELKALPDADLGPYGAGQWDSERRQAILDRAGIDVKHADPLNQQRALWWDMRHTQGACFFGVMTSLRIENEEDAIRGVVAAFVDHFEYASIRERDKEKRVGYALTWRDYFRKKHPDGLERHRSRRHQRTRVGLDRNSSVDPGVDSHGDTDQGAISPRGRFSRRARIAARE